MMNCRRTWIIGGFLWCFYAQFAQAASPPLSDIDAWVPEQKAIQHLLEQGIMKGYGDGLFRPDRSMNRAELTKVVLLAAGNSSAAKCALSFSDVRRADWFFPFVCEAVEQGIIRGYDDNTFRPEEKVNVAEALKIIAGAFDIDPPETEPWYDGVVQELTKKRALPLSIETVHRPITRAEVSEILDRLMTKDQSRPSVETSVLLRETCEWFSEDAIPTVDLEEVRRVWISWINGVRKENNLTPVFIDRQLNRSAFLWSKASREKNTMDHKRPGQTAYYDYKRIESWFSDLGLEFKNVNRITFTENIGWGYFRCSKKACTQAMIDAIRPTFDFYLAEKGKASAPHWNSIINPQFRLVGMGIAVDPTSKKLFITTHYGTEMTSEPAPVCE